MARTGPQATPPAEVDFRPGVSWGQTSYVQYAPELDAGFTDQELRAIYGKLDKNRNGPLKRHETASTPRFSKGWLQKKRPES